MAQLFFIPFGGSGSSSSSYTFSFTDADLIAGILTVIHGLGSKYNQIAYYDHQDEQVFPAVTLSVDTNTLTADFSNFQTAYGGAIPDVWNGIVTK